MSIGSIQQRLAGIGLVAPLVFGGCGGDGMPPSAPGSSGDADASTDGGFTSLTTAGTSSTQGDETADTESPMMDDAVGDTSTASDETSTSDDATSYGDGNETTTGTVCGDGVAEGDEECDGADLAGASCRTRGFTGGALACHVDCTLDPSDCFDSGCCTPGPSGSCLDPTCNAQVCSLFDACCDVGFAWDQHCVDLADEVCEVCGAPTGVCGNALVDQMDEVCDGPDLQGQTCQTSGYMHGSLSCAADCMSFETIACFDLPPWGDCCTWHPPPGGCIDPVCSAEVCATAPDCCESFWAPICADLANQMCVACGAQGCGNGVIDNTETCDGPDLGGASCTSFGYDGGTLGCTWTCVAFDTSACADFGGACCSPNPTPGCFEPSCTQTVCANDPSCCAVAWDPWCAQHAEALCSACQPGECGNDIIELGESCDGTELAGQSCTSLGYSGGDLSCAADCSGHDPSACTPAAGYGDCLAAPPEVACMPNEECGTDGSPPAGSVCWQKGCVVPDDCPPAPPTGDAPVTCSDVDMDSVTECHLACSAGETCPDGMVCAYGLLCGWIAP